MPTLKKFQNPRLKKREMTESKKKSQEIYNTNRWQKLRKAKLMANPVCEICGKELATQVHHKDSFLKYENILKRKEVAYNFDNLQSLCEWCHINLHRDERKKNI